MTEPSASAAGGRDPVPPTDWAPDAPPGPLLRLIRDQRLAFLIVGGLNTAISFLAFLLFSRITTAWGGDLPVLAGQGVAMPVAFVLHRRFVFRVTGHVLRDLGRFILVNAVPIGVNLAVLPVLTTVFGWPVLISQVGFTAAWAISSYFLHRGFSFARSAADRASAAPPGAAPDAGGSR